MQKKELSTGKRAVVLLSGGIDSSTVLAIAGNTGCETFALSFDYHQRHSRELVSARKVAASLGVRKHLSIQFDLTEIGGSALTSDMDVPKSSGNSPLTAPFGDTGDQPGVAFSRIPVTYVPARNTIFLSFALAWAEVLEAENIFIGANAIDYSGYPDCRPEYLRAFEDMANLATRASVDQKMRFGICAPLISMKKSEIIQTGIELGLDYSLTWSCYDPQPAHFSPPPGVTDPDLVPCGRCESCVFRAKGFREAGIDDPLMGAGKREGGV